MSISDNIRRLRIVNNLKQQELADAIFVSRTAIANYESGRRIPDIDTLKAIAKVFNVSINELTDEDVTINVIRNEITHTDVLKPKNHRSFIVPLMNILLTVALLISIAAVLIPAIKNNNNKNQINNLNIENISKVEMVLTDNYISKSFLFTPLRIDNVKATYNIYNFNLETAFITTQNKAKYEIMFMIHVWDINNELHPLKGYENIKEISSKNSLTYIEKLHIYIINFPPVANITVYFQEQICYVDIQESE